MGVVVVKALTAESIRLSLMHLQTQIIASCGSIWGRSVLLFLCYTVHPGQTCFSHKQEVRNLVAPIMDGRIFLDKPGINGCATPAKTGKPTMRFVTHIGVVLRCIVVNTLLESEKEKDGQNLPSIRNKLKPLEWPCCLILS